MLEPEDRFRVVAKVYLQLRRSGNDVSTIKIRAIGREDFQLDKLAVERAIMHAELYLDKLTRLEMNREARKRIEGRRQFARDRKKMAA
jgi:hypothetical protein